MQPARYQSPTQHTHSTRTAHTLAYTHTHTHTEAKSVRQMRGGSNDGAMSLGDTALHAHIHFRHFRYFRYISGISALFSDTALHALAGHLYLQFPSHSANPVTSNATSRSVSQSVTQILSADVTRWKRFEEQRSADWFGLFGGVQSLMSRAHENQDLRATRLHFSGSLRSHAPAPKSKPSKRQTAKLSGSVKALPHANRSGLYGKPFTPAATATATGTNTTAAPGGNASAGGKGSSAPNIWSLSARSGPASQRSTNRSAAAADSGVNPKLRPPTHLPTFQTHPIVTAHIGTTTDHSFRRARKQQTARLNASLSQSGRMQQTMSAAGVDSGDGGQAVMTAAEYDMLFATCAAIHISDRFAYCSLLLWCCAALQIIRRFQIPARGKLPPTCQYRR